jgi:hypothetical protein
VTEAAAGAADDPAHLAALLSPATTTSSGLERLVDERERLVVALLSSLLDRTSRSFTVSPSRTRRILDRERLVVVLWVGEAGVDDIFVAYKSARGSFRVRLRLRLVRL